MFKTGIFFHYQQGQRLADFPGALAESLAQDNVFLYDAFYPLKPASAFDLDVIPLDIVLRVHSREMIERVRQTGAFEGALMSASGTVSAAVRIWGGEIDNAFVFTGYGDHHAGRDHFGGGCYFNGAAMAMAELRERYGAGRFAVVDTDAHHGDGTWDIFESDPQVMYICFCSGPNQTRDANVNVQTGWYISDEQYLELVRSVLPRLQAFGPEAIFWNWGYDGTRGDYGDMGLSPAIHVRLAELFRDWAAELSRGRLITVLCGGSRRDLITQLAPRIIGVLANRG